VAARVELGRRSVVATAAVPALGSLIDRCAAAGASGFDLALGGGKFVLHARGRIPPVVLGCLVGAEPGDDGVLAKNGPRVVAEKGGLRVASPTGEPAVSGRLAALLASGKRADVAIAFVLEGAEGLLTLDRRGGALLVRLPAKTGVRPAMQAIAGAWDNSVRAEARGNDIIVRARNPAALIRVARAAFVDIVPVSGGSMRPTLGVGEVALILRKPIAGPARPGDVVFYNDPDAPVTQVKRVLALAGERVRISGRRVMVNGEVVPAESRNPDFVYEDGEGQTTGQLWREKLGDAEWATLRAERPVETPDVDTVVPSGTLYVLGDSRDSSRDSRQTGPAPFAAVLGRATMIIWSPIVRWHRLGQAIR